MKNRIGIIIIDDNELDLMISERLINRVNPDIMVITFSSGAVALEWLESIDSKALPQNLIFLVDIYIPEMNGFEIVKRLSKHFEGVIPAMYYLLSASIDDTFGRRMSKYPDIKGFIGKPLSVEAINEMVQKMI